MDSKVSGRFGHSGYFIIVDPRTLKYEAYPGVSSEEDQQISKFIDPDINKIIVGNIGPALYNEIVLSGCKVYLCRNMQVADAIEKVRNGEVPELNDPTLNKSIHSARKTGDIKTGRGSKRGAGPDFDSEDSGGGGFSQGRGSGRRRGGSIGHGSGRGKGSGRGRGL